MIKVKPAEGSRVSDPATGNVIAGEIYIERSPAVVRLIKNGDLILVNETPAKAEKKSKGDK